MSHSTTGSSLCGRFNTVTLRNEMEVIFKDVLNIGEILANLIKQRHFVQIRMTVC